MKKNKYNSKLKVDTKIITLMLLITFTYESLLLASSPKSYEVVTQRHFVIPAKLVPASEQGAGIYKTEYMDSRFPRFCGDGNDIEDMTLRYSHYLLNQPLRARAGLRPLALEETACQANSETT